MHRVNRTILFRKLDKNLQKSLNSRDWASYQFPPGGLGLFRRPWLCTYSIHYKMYNILFCVPCIQMYTNRYIICVYIQLIITNVLLPQSIILTVYVLCIIYSSPLGTNIFTYYTGDKNEPLHLWQLNFCTKHMKWTYLELIFWNW